MFTGLIQHVSALQSAVRRSGDVVLTLDLGPMADSAELGASIALDGACMTITSLKRQHRNL